MKCDLCGRVYTGGLRIFNKNLCFKCANEIGKDMQKEREKKEAKE